MLALLASPLLLAGCPEPQQKFDDFVNRTNALDLWMPQIDMATPSAVYDISGQFLAAIDTTILPGMPLQVIATNKLAMNMDGTATLDLSLQPLAVSNRMPVGAPIAKSGVAVDAKGTFVADLGQIMVPGAANPTGSDITATVKLAGSIKSKDVFCGDVTGMLLMPLMQDLAGSTFGAIRVPDGTVGANLPPPLLKCPAGGGADGGSDDGGGADAGAPADMATTD